MAITKRQVDNAAQCYVEKEAGGGYKIDPDAPDFGWQDIIGDISPNGNPSNQPSLTNYNSTGIYQYQFGLNDEIAHVFHMPHDYAPGTDVYIHAHWSQDGVPTDNTVEWQFDVIWAKRDGSFGTQVTTSASDTAGTSALVHHVDEVKLSDATPSGALLDTADLEVDGIFVVRTKLVTNGSGQNPFLHTVDIHYQSTNIGTKNSASPFYG